MQGRDKRLVKIVEDLAAQPNESVPTHAWKLGSNESYLKLVEITTH